MSTISVADQTFIAAPATVVARSVHDQQAWRRWWPDLALTVTEDRAAAGVRWQVGGAIEGTMEVWLNPTLDGVVMNYFLHGEPTRPLPHAQRAAADAVAAIVSARRIRGRDVMFEVKFACEAGRAPGDPARTSPGSAADRKAKE